MKQAGRIRCPAPLPEELAGPLLTKMLDPAPYKVPEKKTEKEAKKTRGGLRHHARPASEEDEEEEDESPTGGRKKRTATVHLEAESPKREKLFFRKSPLPSPIAARCGILWPSP